MNLLINTIVPALVSLLVYKIQQTIDNQKQIKTNVRLMSYDIITVINNIGDWNDKPQEEKNYIPSNSLTSLVDWRESFSIVNDNLQNEAAWSVFQFYTTLEDMRAMQEQYTLLKNKETKYEMTDREEMQQEQLLKNFYEHVAIILKIPGMSQAIEELKSKYK